VREVVVQPGTYVITGASGMIGGMLAGKLLSAEAYRQGRIRVIGTARSRNTQRVGPPGMTWLETDCREQAVFRERIRTRVDYIIHCAAPTASSYMVSNPVETADSIIDATRNMLELARWFRVKSIVCLSSMEVYGQVSDIGRPRTEEELGMIDLRMARNSYPLGKRIAEHYCHSYYQEYGVPAKIARLAQTFGAGVRQEDQRVYMQFARAVLERRDIVLKTAGMSMGNYCAVDDAVDAIFTILYSGKDGEVYNVVNEANTMRIREMAELVAKQIAGGSIGVRYEPSEMEKAAYAPDTELRLSGEKLRRLGWTPGKNLASMYWDVIRTLKSSGEPANEFEHYF